MVTQRPKNLLHHSGNESESDAHHEDLWTLEIVGKKCKCVSFVCKSFKNAANDIIMFVSNHM